MGAGDEFIRGAGDEFVRPVKKWVLAKSIFDEATNRARETYDSKDTHYVFDGAGISFLCYAKMLDLMVAHMMLITGFMATKQIRRILLRATSGPGHRSIIIADTEGAFYRTFDDIALGSDSGANHFLIRNILEIHSGSLSPLPPGASGLPAQMSGGVIELPCEEELLYIP